MTVSDNAAPEAMAYESADGPRGKMAFQLVIIYISSLFGPFASLIKVGQARSVPTGKDEFVHRELPW